MRGAVVRPFQGLDGGGVEVGVTAGGDHVHVFGSAIGADGDGDENAALVASAPGGRGIIRLLKSHERGWYERRAAAAVTSAAVGEAAS